MAAYIPVPRDLSRVQTKYLINLTKRQLFCFGLAALIGVPSFFLLRKLGNNSVAAMGMMIVMLPLFFLGMYERDGQPLEVLASHFIQAKFIRPCERPYRTNNYYRLLMRQAEAEKEVDTIVFPERATKQDDGIPRSAQQSIPFQRMFADGICRVTDSYYTKTIQYQDINYQLATQEDQKAIFDEWCGFLNFFDSSIHFELSFMNMATDAESMKDAKPKLEHIQIDLLNNFRHFGVSARVLNGKERLQLMHSMFHMGDPEKFLFRWEWLVESGLSVKDFIAPTSFSFPGKIDHSGT